MTKWVILVAICAGGAMGQDKPKDGIDPDAYRAAMERLQAKAAEKNATRAEMVSISRGELDDLRQRVRELEAEVASLKGGGTTRPAIPKRNPTKIEVGMTRQDVERFVKSKLGALRIAEAKATNGRGGKSGETMRIEKVSKVWAKTGTQGSLFGQTKDTYGNVDQVDGVIVVTFEDGVVTFVNGQ